MPDKFRRQVYQQLSCSQIIHQYAIWRKAFVTRNTSTDHIHWNLLRDYHTYAIWRKAFVTRNTSTDHIHWNLLRDYLRYFVTFLQWIQNYQGPTEKEEEWSTNYESSLFFTISIFFSQSTFCLYLRKCDRHGSLQSGCVFVGHRSKQAATLDNKNGCWSEKKVFRRIGRSSHHIPVKRKKTTTLQSVDADLKRIQWTYTLSWSWSDFRV